MAARFVEWHLAGEAQPLAVTMNEGVCLAVEVDQQHIQRRLETGYCDEMASTLDEALHQVREACNQGQPLSIGLIGNAAEVYPELVRRGIIPDMVTDQTSAHDALNGYIPAGLSLQEADEKLHQAEGEVILDFTSVIRVDSKGLRELGRLADRADAKSTKFVLRGVNVNIYKVLKLMRLAPRFLFRA